MNRLTFHKSSGKKGIIGINEQNQHVLTAECIDKLVEYEDTGFNPEFLATIPDILMDIKERLNKPSAENIKSCVTAINFIFESIEKDR